jgi:hypothetical protein
VGTANTTTVGGITGIVGSTVLLGNRTANYTPQGIFAVAIGDGAGNTVQGQYAVAAGFLAGSENQGANSIAIGASAGQINQPANSIVINASGSTLNGATASALYVDPVRRATANQVMYYNTSTKEVSQGLFTLASYTTSTLNTITSTATGVMVLITDLSGGALPCFYDGTDWKTMDGTII